MERTTPGVAAGAAVFLAALLAAGAARAEDGVAAEAGRYLFRAAGCAACHTDAEGGGAPLAGGRAFETPFGTFYSPNITPDPEHGIGAWSAEQFVAALREGVGPAGEHYYPVFPYTAYAKMRRDDALAIWAYLQSVEPVAAPDREHELVWWVRLRIGNLLWKWLFLDEGELAPDPSRSETWNRGAYLVEALAHCAECHSPRGLLGAIDEERRFAGTDEGPEGPVPNITSDEESGIGSWAPEDVAEYLSSGFDPDYDVAGGIMAEVIEEGTSHLDDADRAAIGEYIVSLPPVPGEAASQD